jgi:DNA mismatch repair protein MutS
MVHSHNFYNLYQTTYETYSQKYGRQVCVFLQKGSFYEIYGQQDPTTQIYLNTGKECMDIFSIQIHTYENDAPGGRTGFYGGVPVYTLDKWAGKLTQKGWTVVVIEEVKNGAGVISKREVTHVLSAGTHIAAAERDHAFFVAALWFQDRMTTNQAPVFGVATTDLSTGQVFLYQGAGTGTAQEWHMDDLRHYFQVYAPRELVLYIPTAYKHLQTDQELLRRSLHIPVAPIHIRVHDEASTTLNNPVAREDYMRQMFQPRTALPLRTWLRVATDGSSLSERALVSLLRFAEDHAPNLASCLQAPQVWHPTQNVQIINNALTQLNLVGSTPDQQCVQDLFVSPQTAMGKRSLTARLCKPVVDAAIIRARQEEIQWILDSSKQQQKEIEAALSLLYDLSRLHRSIIRGTLQATECLQLVQSYTSAAHLWKIVQNSPFQTEQNLHENIQQCLTEFTALFDTEKARKAQISPTDTGFLQDSVGPNSAAAEKRIAEIFEKANDWLAKLTEFCGVKSESVSYKPTDSNTFCVHTTKTVQKAIETLMKQSISHNVYVSQQYNKLVYKTLTSAARIEHPSLDTFQQEYDGVKGCLARMLAAEVPAACIKYSVVTRDYWQQIEDWIVTVDLAMSMAKTAQQQGWIKPTIVDTSDQTSASNVTIENLRHPLIEVQKRQSKYVTHNVSLGTEEGQGWLLYGMNASGKSSLMKAIGLAVLLAQVGSYVPATAMTLKPFHRLATRILNQDNLWAGLSSFAVEMSELREILQVADHKTLVLGDELCAGTESISGTAIVAAGIQHLHKSGSRFVLATHLHDLMKLEEVTSLKGLSVFHLHVEYDIVRDCLVYHRTLRSGAGSSMYGLEVAKALHLPTDMIDAAFQMRRKLLGESAIEDAKQSSWNVDCVRKACGSCGQRVSHVLEVHHIEERATARPGQRNQDGTALNHIRNLVTLCQTCHDKHHAGSLEVGQVEDTSIGPVRSITDLSQFKHVEQPTQVKRKSAFSDEAITAIKQTVDANVRLSSKLLVFQIQRDHGIQISEAQLKTLQKKGLV